MSLTVGGILGHFDNTVSWLSAFIYVVLCSFVYVSFVLLYMLLDYRLYKYINVWLAGTCIV